jgi:hypothetical protein
VPHRITCRRCHGLHCNPARPADLGRLRGLQVCQK